MKTKIAALTLLLLAGAAPAALAQGQDPGGPRPARGERPDHPHGQGHPQPPPQPHAPPHQAQPQPPHQAWRPPPPPPAPPRAQTPPPAPQAHETRSFGGGQRRPDERGARTYMRRPGTWVDTEGDATTQGLSSEDRADHEDRQELRDWRRFNGGRVPGVEDPRRKEPPRPDRRRADDGHRGDRVQEGDRRSHDGPWNGGRPDDRRWDRDHDGDRDRHGRPEWRPGVYPHAFRSHHRFHVRPYRRPPHFYVRVWSFGEFLPPAWFGPEYVIEDWWIYGLPAPPYGYDWVRVGEDALLVDDYSGRIVQVVRYLFW